MYAARFAAFSTALVDLLIRADELEVSEEELYTIRALLMELSALGFSQASHIKLPAVDSRRSVALRHLNLP